MNRSITYTVATVIAAVCATPLIGGTALAARPASEHAGTVVWGDAQAVPGMAALSKGGQASIGSVSCGASGSCVAGGSYSDRTGSQAFIVAEKDGTWGRAQEVPGTSALNRDNAASVQSVSCASRGNCSVGGSYTNSAGHLEVFVISEKNGKWGRAEEIPGAGALNTRGYANISSISCASAGNCAAGGTYYNRSGIQAFVVTQKNGRWAKAEQVPGTADPKKGHNGGVSWLSCPSPGNCLAVGSYAVGHSDRSEPFVDAEHKGIWGAATQLPGAAALNAGGQSGLYSVSCTSAGNCAAGGSYLNAAGDGEALLTTEHHGVWSTAEEVPGIAALNDGGTSELNSVSCGSPGNCDAGGFYAAGTSVQAFIVIEKNGSWGQAEEVPGTMALNTGMDASILSLSCTSAECGAGGSYAGGQNRQQAFIVTERSGSWGPAAEVGGTAKLNTGGRAEVASVSCASGLCSAGGFYTTRRHRLEAFVVSQRR
jgi:hypothetical protein